MPSTAPHPFPDLLRSASATGLQGLTILAVEDSRFASEALRLMCQRSGARLRRAEGLAAARAHLAVYRPDVVLVDLGLPDGRGEALIRSLTGPPALRPPLVIAMSGDPDGRSPALAAGAAGFIEKPVPGLISFQEAILRLLPDGRDRAMVPAEPALRPDPLALRDDLAHAAAALGAAPGPARRRYLAGFLSGIARQTNDAPLGAASARLALPGSPVEPMAQLLQTRLAAADKVPLQS